mmetsp:Transcript_59636/g.111599  ORF Transcript_59636/g.111599 Transcript_59636/m.111599 type:complete len:107 (-) Transcript_59636:1381-1701(-)
MLAMEAAGLSGEPLLRTSVVVAATIKDTVNSSANFWLLAAREGVVDDMGASWEAPELPASRVRNGTAEGARAVAAVEVGGMAGVGAGSTAKALRVVRGRLVSGAEG